MNQRAGDTHYIVTISPALTGNKLMGTSPLTYTEQQCWNPGYLRSAAFAKRLEIEQEQTRVILTDLGLIAPGR